MESANNPTATGVTEAAPAGAEFPPDVAERLRGLWRVESLSGATSDMIHQVLHEAIVLSILPPRQWLGEMQLARLFDVSRTPVREALLRLEAEHLAERIPRRGLVVSRITPQEIVDVYVVREAVDGLAAYLAAQEATPAEITHLEWLNAQFRGAAEAGDLDVLADLNLQFHEAVAHASRNTLLVEIVKRIHRLVRRFRGTTFADPGRAESAGDAHRRLIAAIAAGDGELARRIAMDDMAVARQIRIAMLSREAGVETLARP